MSGRQDSNLRPPAPKAGALTGLRYAPNVFQQPLVEGFIKRKFDKAFDFLVSKKDAKKMAEKAGFEPAVRFWRTPI